MSVLATNTVVLPCLTAVCVLERLVNTADCKFFMFGAHVRAFDSHNVNKTAIRLTLFSMGKMGEILST